MKKKEDSIDLKVETRMTYLQGLGPETRQGPSPTSSFLGSGDLAKVTRSSAGPSLRERTPGDTRCLSDSSLESLIIFFIFFCSITLNCKLIATSLPKGPATAAEQLSLLGL
jgi:hypothetical protein